MQEVWAQLLVGELRFHMLHGVARFFKKLIGEGHYIFLSLGVGRLS